VLYGFVLVLAHSRNPEDVPSLEGRASCRK